MVLQEFFNICLMKSLWLLDLCFILLSPASGAAVISSEFAKFTCKERYFVKLGENVSIACKSNKEITVVKVTFCSHHNDSCPDKSNITTEAGMYEADNGRISLKKNVSSVYLNIRNVQISDHRRYRFCLKTNNGQECLSTCLNVNAPYTIGETIEQNGTTFVCKASGGYPERPLYWFDENGTNLTHKSELEVTRAEDGSFVLSSTLQVELPVGGISYCCSFNNTACSHTDSTWTTTQITTPGKQKSEGTFNLFIPLAIVAVLVIGVAGFLYKRKKGANDAHCSRRSLSFSQTRENKFRKLNTPEMPPDQISVTTNIV